MADVPDYARLREPISADKPCGEYLEDTQALAAFDAYRIFGLSTGSPDDRKDADGKATAPDWREIRLRSLSTLEKSKDFRLLAHLAASVIRLEGLQPFVSLLEIAADWIHQYWESVYPPIDDDAIFRRNALNGLADRFAIADPLRRLPLLLHPQLGKLSLRDVDLAASPERAEAGDPAQVSALLTAVSIEALQALQQQARAGLAALARIEARMRDAGGAEGEPDFAVINSTDSSRGALGVLVQIDRLVVQQLVVRGEGEGEGDRPVQQGESPAAVAVSTTAVGSIRSRQDAIRALDAVAAWFRQNEPSSPVPLFADRAKRLVSMSFLDILEDVAPGGVTEAKTAGGIKPEG